MNEYIRAAFVIPFDVLKMGVTKLFHWKDFRGTPLCMISPLSEITLDRGGELSIGKNLKY